MRLAKVFKDLNSISGKKRSDDGEKASSNGESFYMGSTKLQNAEGKYQSRLKVGLLFVVICGVDSWVLNHLGFTLLRLEFHFCATLHSDILFTILSFCLLNVSSKLNITSSHSEKKV